MQRYEIIACCSGWENKVEKGEVEEAARRLGVEEKSLLRQIMKGTGIAAIILIVLLFIYAVLNWARNISTYPHVRSPYIPRNRFLAFILLNASDEVKYGVFSRIGLL